jgi:predicted phosphodiesterase
MKSRAFSRRSFLTTTAAATGALALHRAGAAERAGKWADESFSLSFYVIGDTHYLADAAKPAQLDEVSADVTRRFLDVLNSLPGTAIPEASRAGTVAQPRGLLHAGDLIDSGDKNGGVHPQMQQTEWAAWLADFGLTGSDARLKVPVYEVHGNHDAPHGTGLIIDRITERNKRRPDVTNVSANGLHYSWDWGPVHFVCLGIIVGSTSESKRQRRYAALESLAFLTSDLAEKVGSSGRPVVLMHHVDVARYTGPCDPDAPFANKEWDACDVHAFHEAIKSYNIAAIFYGHTHARNVFRWDGASAKAAAGIPVFNVDNASHFREESQAFFYVEMNERELVVREYSSPDRWATSGWTPMSWTVPIGIEKKPA